MASDVLDEITAPTLFIVGGDDMQVLELNREVHDHLSCETELHVVEGLATSSNVRMSAKKWRMSRRTGLPGRYTDSFGENKGTFRRQPRVSVGPS